MARPRYHGYVIVSVPKLRRARRMAYLTQKELAEKAGVNMSTMSRIEQNYTTYNQITTVRKLAAALGLKLEDLLDAEAMEAYFAEDEKLEDMSLADLIP